MQQKKAIIIGAGPGGLTAAYELLDKSDIKPVVFEMTADIGGIAKTVNYKGNRLDVGGHRFFSKSERIIQWWQNILPMQSEGARDDKILNRPIPLNKTCQIRECGSSTFKAISGPDPEKHNQVMLYRQRFSRIYFIRKFFHYPLSLSLNTLANLGPLRVSKILLSYIKTKLSPLKKIKNLEEFFISRFGHELYHTFFKDYTQKVWGVPCREIQPEWGAQRIKGLSISKALLHSFKNIFRKDRSLAQKKTETSLINQFMYPKYGPGQMWEETARIIKKNGGELYFHRQVVGLKIKNNRITDVEIKDANTQNVCSYPCDYVISTMPVKDLIKAMAGEVNNNVQRIAQGLIYRDFITVGLLLNKLKIKNDTKLKTINNLIPDHWVYIQEPDVKAVRLQIFNNWSPYLVSDPQKVWIGLEYLCSIGDELWNQTDAALARLAVAELQKIGMIEDSDIVDQTVSRMPKAYPAYLGTYAEFDKLRAFTDSIENLFLIGRNGMHRYNNQDHSMMTAMIAVENIIKGIKTKDNIWSVNMDKDYHEEKDFTSQS